MRWVIPTEWLLYFPFPSSAIALPPPLALESLLLHSLNKLFFSAVNSKVNGRIDDVNALAKIAKSET